MTIPQFEDMKFPILQSLGSLTPGESLSADVIRSFVISHFGLTDEETSRMWKRVPEYSGKMQWALTDMAYAGIIERPSRGRYAITDEGRRILDAGETDLSRQRLAKDYPSFASFINRSKSSLGSTSQDDLDGSTSLNLDKLEDLIERYRTGIANRWNGERYKWKAVRCFQDEWDIEAVNFAEMLDKALGETGNLLSSGNYFARKMISTFAHANPEKVRTMFRELYGESTDLGTRMETFAEEAEGFRKELSYDGWKSTYQDARAMSAYLWLRYPDKYYLYKYTVFHDVARILDSDFIPKRGDRMNNVIGGYAMYDEIRGVLAANEELIAEVTDLLDEECYPDPNFITLTGDFGFYVSSYLPEELEAESADATSKSENKNPEADESETPEAPHEHSREESIVNPRASQKRQDPNDSETASKPEPYAKAGFLSEVFMRESAYDKLVRLLTRKKNVILQGSPGTGKTYAAERLAWSLMGEKDRQRVQMIQFHQSSSYEEFIYGYKPTSDGGFELKAGVFVNFCDKAALDPNKSYFFIIDEINRANISKVFGELLMLIEADKRGESLTLAIADRQFAVPDNVYILGMMNTADRGLALIDYALRRRFAFFEMEPAINTPGFSSFAKARNNEKLLNLIDAAAKLNETIAADDALGRGFRIGHSYFCLPGNATDDDVASIVDFEIAPLLEEYWFDNPEKAQEEIAKLKAAIA